jgi:hypothetical protein
LIFLGILLVVGGVGFVLWLADLVMKKMDLDDDVRQVAGIILGAAVVGLMLTSLRGR